MSTVISVENISKSYRLGLIDSSTVQDDLLRSWARLRGRPDPFLEIGQEEQAANHGQTIWALRDVNFQVQQGEVLGIIGSNGAGKSTLLKLLSRVTAPTTGEIKVKGRIASLLEIGTGFHPELTGRENVYLNGTILGMKKAEVQRKFDQIVDFSGVEKFIDTPVKRYSSGMYVRLAFAVAAHLDPEILVLDEVLAVGDVEFQKKCLGKMGDVAREGRTVLFVSHNMAAITSLCNKTLYLVNGGIAGLGNTREIVGKYLEAADAARVFDLELGNKNVRDEFAQLIRVRFIDRLHNTVDHLAVDREFGIEVSYAILQCAGSKPVPNIFIKTRTEEEVFHSIETQANGIFDEGFYISTVWIPANLLNNETYIVTVGISTLNPVNIHCLQDVQFEVEDNLSSLTRGDFKQRMHGVVRPLLEWETVKSDQFLCDENS